MTVFNKRGKLVSIILKILNNCKQFISVGRGILQEENSGRVVRGITDDTSHKLLITKRLVINLVEHLL